MSTEPTAIPIARGEVSAIPPFVSVVTPVGAGPQPYLADAAASIKHLVNIAGDEGVEVEWVVGLDGQANCAPEAASAVVSWRGLSGIAATRNAALSAAQGKWVIPLDADDKLDARGVLQVLAVAQDRGWGWAGANRLLVTQERTRHWFNHERSFVAGELAEQWNSPFAFHPNSVAVRRELILEAGGWPAVRVNEDLGMILLVSERANGGQTPQVMTYYRVWGGQLVQTTAYRHDKETAFTVIERLVNARREAFRRMPIVRPGKAGGAFGIVREFKP